MKLSAASVINLMGLVEKGAAKTGNTAPVSKQVWPLIAAAPMGLIARSQNDDGSGVASLTADGATVLAWHREFSTYPKHNQP